MPMFGGFPTAFFERYHELVPKSEPADEYKQRLQLYEAYHHLNHTLMFGVRRLASLFAWSASRANSTRTSAEQCRSSRGSFDGRTRKGCSEDCSGYSNALSVAQENFLSGKGTRLPFKAESLTRRGNQGKRYRIVYASEGCSSGATKKSPSSGGVYWLRWVYAEEEREHQARILSTKFFNSSSVRLCDHASQLRSGPPTRIARQLTRR